MENAVPANERCFFRISFSKVAGYSVGYRPELRYGAISSFLNPAEYAGKTIEQIVEKMLVDAEKGDIRGPSEMKLKYKHIATSMGELRNSILSNNFLGGGEGHIEYYLFGENIDPNATFDLKGFHEKNGQKVPFSKIETKTVLGTKMHYYTTELQIYYPEYG